MSMATPLTTSATKLSVWIQWVIRTVAEWRAGAGTSAPVIVSPDMDRTSAMIPPSTAQSPTEPDRVPEEESDGHAGHDERHEAGREIGIHHQQQSRGQVRPPILFLSVHEQHEPDTARDERGEQPRRIERHTGRTRSARRNDTRYTGSLPEDARRPHRR